MKIIFFGLFFCITAAAQTSKTNNIKLNNIKLNDLQKNKTALPTLNSNVFEQKKNDLNDIKPPKYDLYTVNNEDQAAYEKTLDKQIGELYKLTQDFKTSPKRGELWLRLAELYIEKANIIGDRIQSDFEKNKTQASAGANATGPDLSSAKVYNQKSSQLYEWYLRDFPDGDKVDLALFYLAYQQYELGKINESIGLYNQLVTRFPKSRFATEAHFVLAENFFDNEKWADALKHYAYVVDNEKSAYNTLSIYKAAWCLFRTEQSDKAISYLQRVVKLAHDNNKNINTDSGRKIKRSNLDNEAIRDLVVFFADADKIDPAIDYFKSLKSPQGDASIEKLAYYLSGKGNIKSSKKVFKYLISQNPLAAKNFDYQFQVVQNYFFSQQSEEFKTELKILVQDYASKSKWHSANKSNTEFIKASDQKREQILRNYILQQHQNTQNTRAESAFKSADEAYQFYLLEFAQSEAAADMHFLYGELLYDMSRYNEAAAQYEIVVNQYPNNQYFDKAFLNLLFSLEKLLSGGKAVTTDTKKEDDSLEPVALDKLSEKFVKYSELYLKKHPTYEKAADLKFRMARLYYMNNHFDSAETYFKEIIKNYPNTDYAEYSANLLLDIYSLKKDYVGLEKNATELLQNKPIASSKLGDDIRSILEKTNFKKAQDLDAKAQYLESAQSYLNFTHQYPNSSLIGMAFFNAGVNFEKTGKSKESMTSYENFLKSDKASDEKLKHQARVSLAKYYQDSGQFDLSAQLYTDLASDKNAKSTLKESYLFNSALMFELVNNKTRAANQYETYKGLAKDEAEKSEVVFKIAELNRNQKNNNLAIKNYKAYVQLANVAAEKKIEALYWIFALSDKKSQASELKALESNIQKLLSQLPEDKKNRSVTYLAKIKLLQAEEVFSQLKQSAISNIAEKQQASVNRKLELMKQLNQMLSEVIRLNSPEESIAALYTLGLANENMVVAFQKVSVPKDLNEEEKKLYLAEIEKIIAPFREKSAESYKLAVEQARNFTLYSQAYRGAYQKMSEINPAEYYDSKAAVAEVRLTKDVKNQKITGGPQLEELKKNSTEVLSANPTDVEALNTLAIYYYIKNQPEAAIVLLKKAILSDKSHSMTYNNLGLVLLEKQDVPEAIKMFDKALDLDSKNVFAAANLAFLYATHKDYSKPLSNLKCLTDKNFNDKDALNNYAILLSAVEKK